MLIRKKELYYWSNIADQYTATIYSLVGKPWLRKLVRKNVNSNPRLYYYMAWIILSG